MEECCSFLTPVSFNSCFIVHLTHHEHHVQKKKVGKLQGDRLHCFSPKRNELRNQTWSSVFGNVHVSNLSETLLEGSKDHLLNRARTDLSVSASMIHKNERRYKIGHYKKYNTTLLNLIENKLDYKRNYCE